MPFIPPSFKIPEPVETDLLKIRPITIHDVVKDYEAVMTSRDHLWDRFGEVWGWPPEDLSLEQDLIDLAWHQKEAQIRSSFNYAVMSPDEDRLLGCIYIDPPTDENVETDVWYWIRSSELPAGLELILGEFVLGWLQNAWPFRTVNLNGKLTHIIAVD